jgi:uncharacterized protein YggU (UPF0235/DUF167 family)
MSDHRFGSVNLRRRERARHFGCPRALVSIRRGATGRLKLIKIESQ